MRFLKYHGLGNDYLVLPDVDPDSLTPAQIRAVCDRHRGVGSDGILVHGAVLGSEQALRIFNPDGTEAEKSGNGLRIFARYLFEVGSVGTEPFVVQTRGGAVRCQVRDAGNAVFVEMGRASFASADVPVTGPPREVVSEAIVVDGETLTVTAVSMGNPHCVVPMPAVSEEAVRIVGPVLEDHAAFPNRTNVQLMSVRDAHTIDIAIWERGAGYTLASGSSSCAAAAAAVRLGKCTSPITVHMPGGALEIGVDDSWSVTMLGPVAKVAEGMIARGVTDG